MTLTAPPARTRPDQPSHLSSPDDLAEVGPPGADLDPSRDSRDVVAAAHERRSLLTARLLDEAHHPTTSAQRRRELLDEVVVANHRVARAVARRYRGRGVGDDDLEQAACEGLVRAAHRFDPGHGHDFLTYAVPSMRGEVQRFFRDHGWAVRPPRRLQQLQWSLNRAAAALAVELGREPDRAELRARLGIDEATLREVEASFGCFNPPSLDRPVSPGSGASLGDQLRAPAQHDRAEAWTVLRPALLRLPARDREILWLRYFEDLTQREIGAVLGVTQMQVSRLITRIMRDLRAELTDPREEPRAIGTSATSGRAGLRTG